MLLSDVTWPRSNVTCWTSCRIHGNATSHASSLIIVDTPNNMSVNVANKLYTCLFKSGCLWVFLNKAFIPTSVHCSLWYVVHLFQLVPCSFSSVSVCHLHVFPAYVLSLLSCVFQFNTCPVLLNAGFQISEGMTYSAPCSFVYSWAVTSFQQILIPKFSSHMM